MGEKMAIVNSADIIKQLNRVTRKIKWAIKGLIAVKYKAQKTLGELDALAGTTMPNNQTTDFKAK